MVRNKLWPRLLVSLLLPGLVPAAGAQHISGRDRANAEAMLEEVAKDVQKHYYDPSFHGLDWDATVAESKQKIKEANSYNLALAQVAQALVTLSDSHTFFLPPPRPYILHYGFEYQMIGDHCYIIRVRPGTDAEAKGLKPGDEIRAVEIFPPSRDNLWKMKYRYNVLRPELALRLTLRDIQGRERQVEVEAKVRRLPPVWDMAFGDIWGLLQEERAEEHNQRARWALAGDGVGVLRFPVFSFSGLEIEGMVKDARKRPGLILDLRGNPGGTVETLRALVGGLFDKDIKVYERVGRKGSKPEVAKSMGSHAFGGKLIVLVDSESASAAELFARVVQLEKRGEVIGDRTSGSVMEAAHYTHKLGVNTVLIYGASVTEADLIMSDGRSLEHVGVTPAEVALPTAADLAAGRDPVLAHAAAILGVQLSPEDAGKMFPYEWAAD